MAGRQLIGLPWIVSASGIDVAWSRRGQGRWQKERGLLWYSRFAVRYNTGAGGLSVAYMHEE
jgi:hypothetical protein